MRRKSPRVERWGAWVVVVLLGLAAAATVAAQSGFPQQATIAGEVQGVDEDEGGSPRRVCIQDDNLDSPVLVVDDEKGHELLEYVGRQVEVEGTLDHTDEATDEGYDFQITVASYRVLD